MRYQEFELFIIVIIDGLEHFCQPNGWKLYTTNFEPKFFISVLTDETGRRFYCACLTFSEAISRQSLAGNANRGNYYAIYYPKTSTIRKRTVGEFSSSATFQLFYLPIGESNGLNGADEGDDEVEDHLEESSRDFVNARLQLDQGMIGVNASRNLGLL